MPTLPAQPLRRLRRVVVTGLGILSPLGVGLATNWARLCAGEGGLAPHALLGVVAGVVPRGGGAAQWDPSAHVPRSETRTLGPDYIAFALGAAGEALGDAGLLPGARGPPATGAALSAAGGVGPYSPLRVGVAVGCGVGGLEEVGNAATALAGGAKLSPFFVPRVLLNMAAGGVALRFGLRGPNLAPGTACASGAHAIGEAARAIACGAADAMVAGGSEAAVGALSVAGFGRARALGAGGEGEGPFSARRSGFLLAEGAGCVVLESLEGALARRAPTIYGEVRGYGAGGDAFHATSPRADGSGAAACMVAALREGGLSPEHVGYVNAHATGTPGGDGVEAAGIAATWAGARVAVSSTKGALGHLLGGAGAVEAVLTLQALRTGWLPATRGLAELDAELEPLSVEAGGPIEFLGRGGAAGAVRREGLRAALSNSFGFGGTNASLLFARLPESDNV
jgi:3-oxoacyl-[acyl-carrier-protein] synthase II